MKTLLLIGLLAPFAPSQDLALAGSQSYILEAPSLVGAGGTLSSFNFTAEVSLEGPTVPLSATSSSYSLLGAPALFGSGPSNTPVLFGVSGGLGTKDGGTAVTLFGRNLLAPGAAISSVTLGGAPLANLQVASDTTLTGVTGPGKNPFQNPLGAVDATLSHGTGASARAGAFGYKPALVADSLAVPGGLTTLSLHTEPLSIVTLAFGGTIPGVAVPLFNLDGALELVLGLTTVVPFTPAPLDGHFQLVAPLPADPALSGLSLPMQAVAFSSLATLSGSFSNVMLLHIQ